MYTTFNIIPEHQSLVLVILTRLYDTKTAPTFEHGLFSRIQNYRALSTFSHNKFKLYMHSLYRYPCINDEINHIHNIMLSFDIFYCASRFKYISTLYLRLRFSRVVHMVGYGRTEYIKVFSVGNIHSFDADVKNTCPFRLCIYTKIV